MRKLLLSTAAAVALSSGAMAADLPARAPAMAPAPIFVGMNWTGFYVGLQAGYQFGKTESEIAPGFKINYANDGFIGGVHAGYNLQFGSIVAGVEGDIEYSDVRGSQGIIFPLTTKIDWQGSIRARLGYAVDRALLYVTAGAAYADLRNSFGVPVVDTVKSDWGWTVGAGIEYAIAQNWSVRGEYRYTDMGRSTFPLVPFRVENTSHAVRMGLSYRFGGPAGPVVAKY